MRTDETRIRRVVRALLIAGAALAGISAPAGRSARAEAAPPQVRDPRLQLDLLAENPVLVTPTGIACDEQGRLFVLECHTHFRPKDYQGPAGDRVRIFADADRDGTFERVTTFAEGIRLAMGIVLAGPDKIYLATRSSIRVLEDTDHDGRADTNEILVALDTAGDYPHNGLSGLAWGPRGELYFGLGENLGERYTLRARDGATLTGGGEGGNVYAIRPEGTGLRQVATGFWNPFGLGVDAFGRLFAVDNDPDSRPPCRLLHVVSGGDYGYRFRLGRKGTHPFQSWNGELPGTLPMVAGTGEAPCAVLAYEALGLPAEYLGNLFVTSWGDHALERYRLEPAGASFQAAREVLVQGDDQFRPVGLCVGPQGELYFTDWVSQSYPLHGQGRLWRLRTREALPASPDLKTLRTTQDHNLLLKLLKSPAETVRRAAAHRLVALDETHSKAQPFEFRAWTEKDWDATTLRSRRELLWAQQAAGQLPAEDAWSALVRRAWSTDPELLAEVVPAWPPSRLPAVPADLACANSQQALALLAWSDRRAQLDLPSVIKLLHQWGDDPFVFSAIVNLLARRGPPAELQELGRAEAARERLAALLARKQQPGHTLDEALMFCRDSAPTVMRAAIQWVGEEGKAAQISALKAAVERRLSASAFPSYLAAQTQLAGAPPTAWEQAAGAKLAWEIFSQRDFSEEVRLAALTAIPASAPELKDVFFDQEFTAAKTAPLQRGLLALWRDLPRDFSAPGRARLGGLRAIEDWFETSPDPQVRADAAQALAAVKDQVPEVKSKLAAKLASASDPGALQDPLNRELARLFRASDASPEKFDSEQRPTNVAGWLAALARAGDAEVGRRIFFQPQGIGCAKCHRVEGRGGQVGPDLSHLPPNMSLQRLVESIVEPSKEIAPQYTSWLAVTEDGRQISGLLLRRNAQNDVTLLDPEGRTHQLSGKQIEEFVSQAKSLMPERLPERLTVQEFRDLIAFLKTRRENY